jgi:hypothetical protein
MVREVVSESFLKNAISKRMAKERDIGPGVFWARPTRIEREGDGPNWRHQFNPDEVPAGYEKAWDRIRHEFEDRYDMAEKG